MTAATIGVMQQSAAYAKSLVTPDHELGERNLLNVLENLDLPSLNLGYVQSAVDVNAEDVSAQPTQNVRAMVHDGALR